MNRLYSTLVKSKISNLTVACSLKCAVACGRDDTTKVQFGTINDSRNQTVFMLFNWKLIKAIKEEHDIFTIILRKVIMICNSNFCCSLFTYSYLHRKVGEDHSLILFVALRR